MVFEEVFSLNKRGQVTIFVIIALVIVAGVAAYFLLSGNIAPTTQIPQEFQPIYNTYLGCLQDTAQAGITLLEGQGGYIELPPFEPGSLYMPFSSQLNFLGNPIPYWYYVSGNNIEKQQVPTVSSMQLQLAKYINEHARDCDFSSMNNQDVSVQMAEPTATVTIGNDQVQIGLKMDITMNKGNATVVATSHKVTINSELGSLYKSATTVYNYEQSSLFLENYTVDALRNYAPVDGIEVSCSPKTWNAQDVVNNLSSAIEQNILSIRSGSGTNYFNIHLPVQNVRFITSASWPSDYEVNPTQGNLMIAQPIGNREGLGILGFCYVPYHFIYDIKYPVLAAVSSGSETFQFPMAVIVQGNLPRNALNGTAVSASVPALCENENTPLTVSVFDSNSAPVEANISYECFSQTCDIGQTFDGALTADFPQCVNGYVVASAPGYQTGKYMFTASQSASVSIILNKLYSRTVSLKLDGAAYSGSAIITFTSSDGTSQTILYPDQNTVNLTEGDYKIQVSIYRSSSITIPATTTQQCVDVPVGGIPGALGATQKQCFDINLPSQVISNALAGGGQTEQFILESDLQRSSTIEISSSSLPAPTSLNQLQNNYLSFANKTVSLLFI